MFHYSALNRHIFKSLQEAYGLKALTIVKPAVTRWLSHGNACKRGRQRYAEIVDALESVIAGNRANPEWVTYRSELLKDQTVLEITVLEDELS